ncbi:MAG: hypothetical protein VX252_00045 [Myxococcota bacterium]|nr:hypothetical protein [Myxococcota bacterium]
MPVAACSLSGLDALARHHWSWISESFLHVSLLEEWGERALSGRIADQYESEIPRAFRLIELMLESKSRITLGGEGARRGSDLPEPGRSVSLMAARELFVMRSADDHLRSMAEEYDGEDRGEVAEILNEAIANRAEYVAWLAERTETWADASPRLCRISDDPAWLPLSRLLLQLLDAIDETSVHMLVLRHAKQMDEAEQNLQGSYEYMLLAVEIARYFGRQEWAIDFHDKAMAGEISRSRIGSTVSQVRRINRERRTDLKGLAARMIEPGSSDSDVFRGDSEALALMQDLARRISTMSDSVRVSGSTMEAMMGRYLYSR